MSQLNPFYRLYDLIDELSQINHAMILIKTIDKMFHDEGDKTNLDEVLYLLALLNEKVVNKLPLILDELDTVTTELHPFSKTCNK